MHPYRTEDGAPKDGPTDPGAVVSKTCNLNQGKTTMKLLNLFKSFKNDESGAVTVDWVVLTGAVVGLALIIGTTVRTGVSTASGNIATSLTNATTAAPAAPAAPSTP